jgi:photosystem II stability/assembly factor-like uncharacterized protein
MTKTCIRFALAVFIAASSFFTGFHTGKASPLSQGITPGVTPQANHLLADTNIWRHINHGLPSVGNNDVHSLVADPEDANIIYGGFSYSYGMSHGVFKTTDGGEHWFPADTGLPASASIMSLVMDPTNRNILYAIHGQVGLYKSTDQAQTWTHLTNIPEDVWCVAVYGAVIYVGGYLTLYLSTNGGTTFTPTFSYPGNGTMNALWIEPGNTAHVIAAWGASLSQTTDSGHTWTQYPLTGCSTAYTVAFAVDPANNDNMLVGTWHCLLRTTDGGATWTKVRDIGHVNFIRYDPMDYNLVYASSDWLGPSIFLKSIDGGLTWNNFDTGFPSSYFVAAMALGPSNQDGATHSAVYAGLSGWGIYTTDPQLIRFKIWMPCILKK